MNTTTATITNRPVVTRREKCIFLLFPWRTYRHDPLWVPSILAERTERLDPTKDLSLAGDDNPMTNKMAQRIGAVIDKRYRLYEWARV